MNPDARVVHAASTLVIKPRGPRWAHTSLCVLDAVFSMGARYTTTARTCRRYAKHAGITPLDDAGSPAVIGTEAEQPLGAFLTEVDLLGIDAFAETVLLNRQRTSPRFGIRKAEASREYARALVDAGIERYRDLPALFGDGGRLDALEKRLRDVRGNGGDDIRLGYLWMLLGDDSRIKPDRMIRRWLARATDRADVSAAEARDLVTGAAGELGCTPWELDHAIWSAERGRRVRVASDNAVRRRHRAHQARWREEVLGVPPTAESGGDSRLPEKHDGTSAEAAGWNLMSDAAVAYSQQRIPVVEAAHGVVETGRFWHNLLSSQPLAFSIAGELRAHPEATLSVLSDLTGLDVVAMDHLYPDDAPYDLAGVQAEWAPRPETHTRDRSAADVAAAVRTGDGRRVLITVEVKYTDDFSRAPLKDGGYGPSLARLDLGPQEVDALYTAKATQFLRSVLLTESVRFDGGCDDVLAVVLCRDDDAHARVVVDTIGTAVPSVPVATWTITGFLDVAARHPELEGWAESMAGRYVPD